MHVLQCRCQLSGPSLQDIGLLSVSDSLYESENAPLCVRVCVRVRACVRVYTSVCVYAESSTEIREHSVRSWVSPYNSPGGSQAL